MEAIFGRSTVKEVKEDVADMLKTLQESSAEERKKLKPSEVSQFDRLVNQLHLALQSMGSTAVNLAEFFEARKADPGLTKV